MARTGGMDEAARAGGRHASAATAAQPTATQTAAHGERKSGESAKEVRAPIAASAIYTIATPATPPTSPTNALSVIIMRETKERGMPIQRMTANSRRRTREEKAVIAASMSADAAPRLGRRCARKAAQYRRSK